MSAGPEVRPEAWLRRPRRVGWFVAVLVAIAVGFVAALMPLGLRASFHEGGAMALVWSSLFTLVFTAPYLFFAYRIARSGIWMGRDRIVIRGPVRTRTVPGNSAVSFAPGVQPSCGNGTPCPILTRADGSEIAIWALGREGLVWSFDDYLEELRPLCDQLNAQLERLYPDHVQTLFQPSHAGSTQLR